MTESCVNYSNFQPTPGYCDCKFPNCIDVANHKGEIAELITCRCEENDSHAAVWQWHKHESSDVHIVERDITFHPIFSQGTAIVRGNKALQTDMVHFWELRLLTVPSGTDVMFGVGTDKVSLDQFKFHFVSALGSDSQSWGYSYNGKFHHNGNGRPYGQRFSQGCILGVYLDRAHGYLEFFLNRRSLGVACTNIPTDPSINIYPMVCSTAAKSSIRLMNAQSVPATLQFRAFKTLLKQPTALDELKQMPGLHSILQEYWFLSPPVRYSRISVEHEYDIADEAVLSRQCLGRKQKYQDEPVDINDIYASAHKIAVRRNSDDDCAMNDLFDEYFHYLF